MNFRIFPLLLFFALFAETAPALEYIRFRHEDGKERNEEGRSMFEAPDGLAFQSRDGQVYAIKWNNLVSRKTDELPFVPYTKKEMLERLKIEFPPDEKYHYLDTHDSFIVVYTTSKPFAQWCENLLKRLHEQYVQHWKKRGVQLVKPEFIMVAIIFSNEERFRQYVKQDDAPLSKEQCAYYHKLTNRIAMYDMTEQQVFWEGNQRRIAPGDIQRFLSHPASYNNVMTLVHEAVHQVGFNTGMHLRFTPSPVWLFEGLAVFHEVPDQRNYRDVGWTLGPHVNRPRLDQLRKYLNVPNRESPIQKMIQDDNLFRPATALDNYALAWGLMYYLERKRPQELAAYLKLHQEKTIDSDDNAEERMKDFEACFGDDWDKFYRDFADFMRRL